MIHENLTSLQRIDEVQKQFDYWRSTRNKREPIPELLWKAAVSLTKEYSIHQISKTLRLNYQKLKRLAEEREKGKNDTNVTSAQFFELNISKPPTTMECIIEIDGPQGRRMKMSLKGETGFDLLEWAKIVLETEA